MNLEFIYPAIGALLGSAIGYAVYLLTRGLM